MRCSIFPIILVSSSSGRCEFLRSRRAGGGRSRRCSKVRTPIGGHRQRGSHARAAAQIAAPGFRPLRVSRIDRECIDVISLSLQPTDGRRLTTPLPGQFVVLRLRPTFDGPPLFRSYSLSGPLSDEQYRVSVKIEPNGAGGTYLNSNVRPGDVLDVSEPRGSFVLQRARGRWCS